MSSAVVFNLIHPLDIGLVEPVLPAGRTWLVLVHTRSPLGHSSADDDLALLSTVDPPRADCYSYLYEYGTRTSTVPYVMTLYSYEYE